MAWVTLVPCHQMRDNGVSDCWGAIRVSVSACLQLLLYFKSSSSSTRQMRFPRAYCHTYPDNFLRPHLEVFPFLTPRETTKPTSPARGPRPSSLALGILSGYCLIPITLRPVPGTWHILSLFLPLIRNPRDIKHLAQGSRPRTVHHQCVLFPPGHIIFSFWAPEYSFHSPQDFKIFSNSLSSIETTWCS